jgi:hypothetical protein
MDYCVIIALAMVLLPGLSHAECIRTGNSAFCSGYGPADWEHFNGTGVTHVSLAGRTFYPTEELMRELFPDSHVGSFCDPFKLLFSRSFRGLEVTSAIPSFIFSVYCCDMP